VILSQRARRMETYPTRVEDVGMIYGTPFFCSYTVIWSSDLKISVNIDERDLERVSAKKQ